MNQSETIAETAIAHGHVASVAALFREHNRTLLAFLQCRLGSLADAQELAQEAYVRMLTLEHPEQIDSLRAFLFRIAANLAVDRLRMRKLREPVPVDATTEPAPELHLAPVPERHVAAAEQWRELQAALRELPAKTSRAFVLHTIEGWPVRRSDTPAAGRYPSTCRGSRSSSNRKIPPARAAAARCMLSVKIARSGSTSSRRNTG